MRLGWIGDHVVRGQVVVPGAAHVAMALAAARRLTPEGAIVLRDIAFQRPVMLGAGGARAQIALDSDGCRVALFSDAEGTAGWTRHAETRISKGAIGAPAPLDRAAIAGRLGAPRDIAAFYAAAANRGLVYGPSFRGITALRAAGDQALVTVGPVEGLTPDPDSIHPCLLDAAFQALIAIADIGLPGDNRLFLPVGIDEVRFYRPADGRVHVHCRLDALHATSARASLDIIDDEGAVLVSVVGLTARLVGTGAGFEHVKLSREPHAPGEAAQTVILAGRPGETGASRPWLLLGEGDVSERLAAAIAAVGGRALVEADEAEVDRQLDVDALSGIIDLRALARRAASRGVRRAVAYPSARDARRAALGADMVCDRRRGPARWRPPRSSIGDRLRPHGHQGTRRHPAADTIARCPQPARRITNQFCCTPATLVLEDDREACALGFRGARYHQEGLGHYFFSPVRTLGSPEFDTAPLTRDELDRALAARGRPDQPLNTVIGDPVAALDSVQRFRQAGVDELILVMQMGTAPHEAVMRSLKLFNDEVMARI